jgi:DNA-binding transcriptional regulator LsrR (DeoR family)
MLPSMRATQQKPKAKNVGKPRFDHARAVQLSKQGLTAAVIAERLHIGVNSVNRVLKQQRAKEAICSMG